MRVVFIVVSASTVKASLLLMFVMLQTRRGDEVRNQSDRKIKLL